MLLDTSGLLNLLSPHEAHHALAVQHYRKNQPRITHNLLLAELVALGHARGVLRQLVLQTVHDLLAAPSVEVVWVDISLTDRALALLHSRLDKAYSLADAVSFVIMRDRGIREALTNDRHFDQEGFQRLLA